MDASEVIGRCRELNVILLPDGDRLVVHSARPLPEDIREEIRQHKPEIISLLPPRAKQWHAEDIARVTRREAICIFWSELFQEPIAFVRDETFMLSVPSFIVSYTDKELRELFGEGKDSPSPGTLKLIHEAKRQGGHITGYD